MIGADDAHGRYVAVIEDAASVLTTLLADDPRTRELDALDLWEWVSVWPGVDPFITVFQWSIAVDVARERLGLDPLPRYVDVFIGEVADAGVRRSVRILREGVFVGSKLGTSFHCKCGWISARVDAGALGVLLADHLAAAHR